MKIKQNLYKDKEDSLYLVDNRLSYGVCVYIDSDKQKANLFHIKGKHHLKKTNHKLKIKLNSWNVHIKNMNLNSWHIDNEEEVILSSSFNQYTKSDKFTVIKKIDSFIFKLSDKLYLHERGSNRVTIIPLNTTKVSLKRIFLNQLNLELNSDGSVKYWDDGGGSFHQITKEVQIEINPN